MSLARAGGRTSTRAAARGDAPTATPIKHLVVIFEENVSFDHYFATYPHASNPEGEPAFHALPETPSVNGLSGPLLTNNPNLSNPQRLDRSQAMTCDQDHGYTDEQKAVDSGLMDKFVQDTGRQKTALECTGKETGTSPDYAVMDYYDGNTVTGLWNYAQHFALSDNSYGTTFGPSTPGAVNVTAGNTYGAICGPASAAYNASPCPEGPLSEATPGEPAPQGTGTDYSDADPYWDICSSTEDGRKPSATLQMGGQNVGDLLDQHHTTWGWFTGGFASLGYVSGKPSTDVLSEVCEGLQKLPSWSHTAVVISWDDSDGWYDHQMGPVTTQSQTPLDALTGTGTCGSNLEKVPTFEGVVEQARCGVGPRLPLLVVSPFAKPNYVDGTFTTQTSVVKFVEDNWLGGQRVGGGSADAETGSLEGMFDFGAQETNPPLVLDPSSGEVVSGGSGHP